MKIWKVRRKASRYAFTLLETVGAAVVLAAILGAAVPMMLLVQSQRHENALRRQAVRAADNLLERVLAVDWSELDEGLAGETIGAADLLDAIPGGAWNLTVIEEPTPVPAKRVTVSVSYRSRGRTGNIHVTAWTFTDSVGQASQPVSYIEDSSAPSRE